MSEKVTMPALGESVTEGTVTRWLKSVGDSVEVDEPLLEVSTDKVDTEIPSPVAGTLEQILVEEDETVEVGADLAVIGDGSGGGQAAAEEAPAEEAPTEETSEAPAQEQPEQEAAEASSDQVSGDDAQEQEQPASSGGGEVSGGQTVTMPALGESVTEGTVTRWLKAEGDDVEVDEPLLEVSTDKVDTEIPSPVAGKLTKILVQEDETVEVGADLAVVGGESSGGGEASGGQAAEAKEEAPQEAAESTPAEAKEEAPEEPADGEQDADDAGSSPAEQAEDAAGAADNATEEAVTPDEEPAEKPAEQEQPAEQAPKDEATVKESAPKHSTAPTPRSSDGDADASAYVTPLVRKLASDHGVDLSSITGTGVGGRIRKQDVLEAAKAAKEAEEAKAAPAQEAAPAPAAAPQAAPAPGADAGKRGTTEKMSRMRKVIAQRMTESLQTSAQLTATVEVDMSKVAALRGRTKKDFEAREGAKLTFLPFIALATVEALKAYPKINSSLDGESIVFHGAEHLGVAVDTERGLMVPVIRDAGDLSIAGLAKKIADLGERTRGQKVTPDELGGGTFTITNYGSAGTLFDTPIINQPQVAILGTGSIVKRPVVITDDAGNDLIAIRSMMYLSLTYDHRVVDGADAGRFLAAIKARLEEGKFEGAL
ncbi:MAG: 2-oxoglutarate dehydrogenase, E2 component, dihydrolipoamide succinyltransferase [Micrococcales bacterium]|nr:2-oxoglutarate dehydrogenase, E2 component, dihydrolipoamide succinyltransferase [Micrococcales bacterium]